VPTVVIPIHGPSGELIGHQHRPDSPRRPDGKPVKYESVRGAALHLDVSPLIPRDRVRDPQRPLFVTEGIPKGDALVSTGLTAVALMGVDGWRGTNELGGKTCLSEWAEIALNGRTVYIVFDSDVMEKRGVHGALVRLKAWLETRGAIVKLIYLPPKDNGS